MKKTLLEIVQTILSKTVSDEVDTIMETPDSEIVVGIVKSTYEDIMGGKNWEHQKRNIVVAPYGTSKPTHVKLPDGLKEVNFINYDKRKETDGRLQYESVKYKHPDDFLRMSNTRHSDADNVLVVEDFSGMKLMVVTDAAPMYYTSFDEKYLVFDSFNSAIEDTIVSSKLQSEGYFFQDWQNTDDFIPDMPAELFPLLETSALRESYIVLKQSDNPIAATRERRNRVAMSTRGFTVAPDKIYPNYGRRTLK